MLAEHFNYWVYIGTLYLVFLAFQDLRNNMNVDGRLNYFMMGITMSLLFYVDLTLWYFLSVCGVSVVVYLVFKMTNVLGGSDIKTILWVFVGFMLLNPVVMLVFLFYLVLLTIIYGVVKSWIKMEKAPYYTVLLCSFFLTGIHKGLYW